MREPLVKKKKNWKSRVVESKIHSLHNTVQVCEMKLFQSLYLLYVINHHILAHMLLPGHQSTVLWPRQVGHPVSISISIISFEYFYVTQLGLVCLQNVSEFQCVFSVTVCIGDKSYLGLIGWFQFQFERPQLLFQAKHNVV